MTLAGFTFLLIGFWVVLSVATAAVRIARRRRVRRRLTQTTVETRCRCGYRLDHLDVLRCPECGRVPGFEATAAELGLTDEQLKRATEKRRERL